ncbi:unnamed protein product [Heterobilharzia americana]|nr:unnamed protein product [Heterobilharzia americana]
MELMKTHYHLQTLHACEGFVKAIFGNAAVHPIWQERNEQKAKCTTFNQWKTEQSWLCYRREIMESQLSTKSKDEIKRIENELRGREAVQQILTNHFTKR